MDNNKASEVGATLLEIGDMLMGSGANTMRIRETMTRIAHSLGYNIELMITHRALSISLSNRDGDFVFSKIKRISPHGVNFRAISAICHMSWNALDDKWSLDKINKEILRIKNLAHYPRLLLLVLVAFADAGFCHNFGGGWKELLVTGIATFIGMATKQEFGKRHYNPYLCVYIAAFVASLIASCSYLLPFEMCNAKAIATSVLFLVPGVPLINSITDLVQGNIQNGVFRGINAFNICFAIACGLLTTALIFNQNLL